MIRSYQSSGYRTCSVEDLGIGYYKIKGPQVAKIVPDKIPQFLVYLKLFWIKEESSGRSHKRFFFFLPTSSSEIKNIFHLRYVTKRCPSQRCPQTCDPIAHLAPRMWPVKLCWLFLFSLQPQCQLLSSRSRFLVFPLPFGSLILNLETNLKGPGWNPHLILCI